MQVAELVKEYLAIIISWPVAILVIAVVLMVLFRKEISNLINRIRQITVETKAGQISVSAVEKSARMSVMLMGNAKDYIVNTIIRPFAADLTTSLERICDTLGDVKQHIRSTVYLRWPLDSEYLVQVTPYVPDGFDRTGRLLSKRVGAVGKAFREGKTILEVIVPDVNEFKIKHVGEYGFDSEETERLRRDRQSYLAIPLRSGIEPFGVAYFDSSAMNTFSDKVIEQLEQQIQQLVSLATNLDYQLEAYRV